MTMPGAVAADEPDSSVAGHYGDPAGEQRALDGGPAVVDRSHRGVVVVSGPDRLSWLHSLTTQSLDRLAPGAPTQTLVLSPHGHVEHEAVVVDDGSRTWLLVEPGAAPALTQFLTGMQFMTRVEVADESERWGVLTVVGPDALTAAIPQVAQAVARTWPGHGTDLVVARPDLGAAWAALLAAGARPAGHDAYEALRIAAGVARAGLDSDHRTLVHEAGWVGAAVHLDKGCYRGQETVARVHNLGRPPRRLVLVHLDGSGHLLPARGTVLSIGDRAAGTLTSAARHYEWGPIGLAMLRRAVPDDALLVTADGVTASIDRDISSPTQPVDLSALRS